MKSLISHSFFILVFLVAVISIGSIAFAADVPSAALIQPDELAKVLQSNAAKPLIFQVGFQKLYQQAHIPGAEYVGAATDAEGIQKLEKRVSGLPKNKAIVLYCGCCPWWHCPNVQPAYELLHSMGFTKVKVLYIAQNFGADWVSKGYPTERGQ